MSVNKKVIIGIFLAIFTFLAFQQVSKLFFSSSKEFTTLRIEQGTLVKSLEFTGKAVPAKEVIISSEVGGRIEKIWVKEGEKVSKGKLLISLAKTEILASIEKAKAEVQFNQANLAYLQSLPRQEEVEFYSAQVEARRKRLEDLEVLALSKIKVALSTTKEAIGNLADVVFNYPLSPSPQLKFIPISNSLKPKLEEERLKVRNDLKAWEEKIARGNEDIEGLISLSLNFLLGVLEFLDDLSLAVNNPVPASEISAEDLSLWKGNVLKAKNLVSSQIEILASVRNSISSAREDLKVTEKQLRLVKSGPTLEEIEQQKAKLNSAKATLKELQERIKKFDIFSPIAGEITKIEVEEGEVVSPFTPLITLFGEGKFEIEAFVPEVDISKIEVGSLAEITFDALENKKFKGIVVQIGDKAKLIEGVPSYKVNLTLEGDKEALEEIREGMTAEIKLELARKDKVLYVPLKAVFQDGEKYYLKLLRDGEVEKVEIELGIEDDLGNVEIKSEEVQQGDLVVID